MTSEENDKLNLRKGARLRTGSVTYEVTKDSELPAGVVPVKPQGTRLLKVACATCGYTARVTKRWIDKAGAPVCPTDHVPMVVDVPTDKPEAIKPAKAAKVAKVAPVAYKVPEFTDTFEPFEESEVDDSEPVEEGSTLAQLLDEIPQ